MSSMHAIPCLYLSFFISQIPWYANVWVIFNSWAPVRLNLGSISVIGLSKTSSLQLAASNTNFFASLFPGWVFGPLALWNIVGVTLWCRVAMVDLYKSLFFIPIYPHSSQSSSWVVSPLITSLDDPLKWSGLFTGSSWVAHRMAISSPGSTLGSSHWVLIATFQTLFSWYHRLLPVLLAPISHILVAPLKKISVLGGWGRGRACPQFAWVLHFAFGSVKMQWCT